MGFRGPRDGAAVAGRQSGDGVLALCADDRKAHGPFPEDGRQRPGDCPPKEADGANPLGRASRVPTTMSPRPREVPGRRLILKGAPHLIAAEGGAGKTFACLEPWPEGCYWR